MTRTSSSQCSLKLAEAEENWQAEHPLERGQCMWNEFKERFMQWFRKIKSGVFRKKRNRWIRFATSLRTLEKRVILGNGARAKIRIGLSEDATRILKWKKQPMTERVSMGKDVLEKDVTHNPAAIYIVLEVEEKSSVSSERERQRERFTYYECCSTARLSLLECRNFIIESIRKNRPRARQERNYARSPRVEYKSY